MKISQRLRISRVRSRTAYGALASAHVIDNGYTDGTRALCAQFPAEFSSIEEGDIWDVTGELSKARFDTNGYSVREHRISISTAELVVPSGDQIVSWLSDNVVGVGPIRAQRIYDYFGVDIYDVLDEKPDRLFEVMSDQEICSKIAQAWAEYGDSVSLKFLQEIKLSIKLGRKVIKAYGRDTKRLLCEDPYRLLSFSAKWSEVDSIAAQLGIAEDDIRRQSAAIEQAVYSEFDKGHTFARTADIIKSAERILGVKILDPERVIKRGIADGLFVQPFPELGIIHASGTWLMERRSAEYIERNSNIYRDREKYEVDSSIKSYEVLESKALKIADFKLNEAQKSAVLMSATQKFSVITGGAGTGKTTVLKCIYAVCLESHTGLLQMALSGRAAARMAEATGLQASTIAGYIKNHQEIEVGEKPLVVIDEASMLDLITFYRVIKVIPEDSTLVLVGDPYQLPPIGGGLILHLLCDDDVSVPITELSVVKRQSSESKIPAVSFSVRNGEWPDLSSEIADDVCFINCPDAEVVGKTLELMSEFPSAQVLCATRDSSVSGINVINSSAQKIYSSNERELVTRSKVGETQAWGIKNGDPIMYTVNDWDRNLQNGTLGRVLEVWPVPRLEIEEERVMAYGRMEMDGKEMLILAKDVERLELAYAITCHKAQGSQFPVVIVPITQSKLLDRTLIYTAITRAQSKVILLGDQAACQAAVAGQPAAFNRRVGLKIILSNPASPWLISVEQAKPALP